jgi:uncharacterized protein
MKSWESGNNKEAALALGEAYTKGIGVVPDPNKALKWYIRAYEAGGYPEAAFAVGLAYATGFTPGAVDPSNWSASANETNPSVNEVLHSHATEAKDPEKNVGKKDPNADPALDEQSTDGTAPKKSTESAATVASTSSKSAASSAAATKPAAMAQNRPLRGLLAVKQDVAAAAAWYRKAADKEHSRATNNLGELYMTGRGVERNDVTGFAYFKKAAM